MDTKPTKGPGERSRYELQAVALNEGLRSKKRLWREAGREQLVAIRLAPWASRRRQDLLELLDHLNPIIAKLTEGWSRKRRNAPRPSD